MVPSFVLREWFYAVVSVPRRYGGDATLTSPGTFVITLGGEI